MVDEDGLEVERTEYYPYGEVQSGGLEKYGFTGKENDADTGLMYYGARYYSPGYRIFVQPDTMLPDVYNPQALNRYSYTLNNPVKYNDPSGHNPVLVAAGVVVLKVGSATVDYGWTAYDIKNDMDVINDPDASASDKQWAATDMTLAMVFEAIEPDELLPINLPLDDLARKGVMKDAKELAIKYAPDAASRFIRVSDDVTIKAGTKLDQNPLENIVYNDHVLNAKDAYHAFPEEVNTYGNYANVEALQGGDGIWRTMVTMEGTYKGKSGTFEYIIDEDGVTCTHRFFRPSKKNK